VLDARVLFSVAQALIMFGTIGATVIRKYSVTEISDNDALWLMPNAHRGRRRDAITVELSRVGGVNTIRN